MIKIWSELPRAQARELAADVATIAWVVFWGSLAWQLYSFLAQFAEAGRTVRGGGHNLGSAGRQLGDSLQGAPMVGAQIAGAVRRVFADAGQPLVEFGTELERFVLVVSVVLALLFVALPLVPWLSRYLPWRWERLQRVRAAHRAIRRAPDLAIPEVERLLASRAVHRLPWDTLLEYTPD
ncbi:MAG: hypothetical protein M3301_03770, partial [Chloroflexota bacterium]|nr:hypothetical protein [Chloroflexota bacterium]